LPSSGSPARGTSLSVPIGSSKSVILPRSGGGGRTTLILRFRIGLGNSSFDMLKGRGGGREFCSQNRVKHISTLYGSSEPFGMLNVMVHIVTTDLQRVQNSTTALICYKAGLLVLDFRWLTWKVQYVLDLHRAAVSHYESITQFQIEQTKFVSGSLFTRRPTSQSG
jgi:hypothetical protein